MATELNASQIRTRAWAGFLCPVASWASQFFIVLVLRQPRWPAEIYYAVMAVQAVLILAGIYLGGQVLSVKRSTVPAIYWWLSLVGVMISVGTIVLIAVVASKSY
jgi:hypothetical protein